MTQLTMNVPSSMLQVFDAVNDDFAEQMNVTAERFARPISIAGKSILVDPSVMHIGKSYAFDFAGFPCAAVKRADASVDVFYLPDE